MKCLFVLLCVLYSCSIIRAQEKSFTLTGTNSSDYEGYKAYLFIRTYDFRNVVFRDSTIIRKGKFQFSGQLTQPSSNASIKLVSKDQQFVSDFVLDTGINHISFRKENLTGKFFKDVEMRSVSNVLKMKLDSTERKAYADQRVIENVKEEYFALSRLRSHELDLKRLQLIEAYPNSYYSLMSLARLGRMVTMIDYNDLLLQTFDKLSPELQSSDLGRNLYKSKSDDIYAKMATKEGQVSPVFSAKDNQNRSFSNKSMQAKPYLLVFTATWCVPCQQQLPKLRKISDNYSKSGLKIVYINLDDDLQKWKKHVQTVPSEWIHISDRQKGQEGKIQKLFYVKAIPTYFLIDAAGKIAYNSDTTDPELLETEHYIQRLLK